MRESAWRTTESLFACELQRRNFAEESASGKHCTATAMTTRLPSVMRGRPISEAEFDKLLNVVPEVRPHDALAWTHYLEGLWLSGLRLEESTVLSWDESSPIWVDLGGRRPKLRIYAEAEKGNRDRKLPITPDFAEFLARIPIRERQGPVFQIKGLQTNKPMTPGRISRVISKIGVRAKLIVDKQENRYVTAHDLRRSFATRWASRVKPATLRLLMRHKSIETTLNYYVDQDADEIADELWQGRESIDTFIDTRPPEASEGPAEAS
jgi:integrase